MTLGTPPAPTDRAEAARWEHTRLRKRMLTGAWAPDLKARIQSELSFVRAEAWGAPDLSSNVFCSTASQLSCLYDREPSITHTDASAIEAMHALLKDAGWSSQMQRVQRDCIGMREMFVRVDAFDGEIRLRPVSPDMVVARADPNRPDQPNYIREARRRKDADSGEEIWTWDELSISDADNPTYRILSEDLKADLTGVYLEEDNYSGAAYPYRAENGSPILPYVLYHAARGPDLFDPYYGIELVEGTLQAGVFWTFFAHSYRSASWPQRYALNVELPAGAVDENGDGRGRAKVVADPATILLLTASESSNGQPMIGQWAPGAEPDKMLESAVAYESRVATFAGISASDFERQSGDPRSGYALAISQEGKRSSSRKFEPVFARADAQLCRVVAILLNRATDSKLAESGYGVQYNALPPTVEEVRAEREHILALLTAGLITKVDAYMQLHGVRAEAATKALAEIAAAAATQHAA